MKSIRLLPVVIFAGAGAAAVQGHRPGHERQLCADRRQFAAASGGEEAGHGAAAETATATNTAACRRT